MLKILYSIVNVKTQKNKAQFRVKFLLMIQDVLKLTKTQFV